MNKDPRIKRTLPELVSALDDQFNELSKSLAFLQAGDPAAIKSVAASLRTIVCRSGTLEGLLWRIMSQVESSDEVNVHQPMQVNPEHSMAKGLTFCFLPLFRAGQGDSRLPEVRDSLKRIIKECEAIYVSGRGYTHENLIKHVAEQVGLAHEAERVQPHIAELSRVIFGNKTVLEKLIASDADLVLEVGYRALDLAANTIDYQSPVRPRFTIDFENTPENESGPALYDTDMKIVPQEGTVLFLVNHEDEDWCANAKHYVFGKLIKDGVSITTEKLPGGSVTLEISGPSSEVIHVKCEIPVTDQPGLTIAVTWKPDEVLVYLNGQAV